MEALFLDFITFFLNLRSLESKIRTLKARKIQKPSKKAGCGSNKTESPAAPILRSDGNESSPKDTSKDGLSAGSFTQDTRTSWSLDRQVPALASSAGTDIKQENSESFEQDKGLNIGILAETDKGKGGTLRKRRGKRKRKNCSAEAKEGSVGESENLGSNNVISNAPPCKEASTSGCNQSQTIKFVSRDGEEKGSCQMMNEGLIGIFNSIAEHKVAFVFRHRLDGQKRARYKKIIRQHMDFDMIRSKVVSSSIRSAKELFRDLLLLANNALVFYSKRTREYKSGVALRDIVLKAYRQHYKRSYNKATSASASAAAALSASASASLPMASLYNPPVKPRSARPRPCRPKIAAKLDSAKSIATASPKVQPKPSVLDAHVPLQSLLTAKKGVKRPVKGKNGSPKQQPKAPLVTKDKKRARLK